MYENKTEYMKKNKILNKFEYIIKVNIILNGSKYN